MSIIAALTQDDYQKASSGSRIAIVCGICKRTVAMSKFAIRPTDPIRAIDFEATRNFVGEMKAGHLIKCVCGNVGNYRYQAINP